MRLRYIARPSIIAMATAYPSIDQLPGEDIVRAGISDLLDSRDTPAAALVRMARPRLEAVGLDVPVVEGDGSAGHTLYGLLMTEDPRTAYSRYNALVSRMVSFARAAEHAPTG